MSMTSSSRSLHALPDSAFGEVDSNTNCRQGADLLSPKQRALCLERGLLGLYRWYTARSQQTRNWNPDTTFAWRSLRRDHDEAVHTIVEGFFAVEQFVPDYVHALLKVIRRSYGRSHFHIRWGSEEAKHADLWRNAVLCMGRRSTDWIDEYSDSLRGGEWALPWDDPVHMLFYTVFQERATQVSYVNLGLAASGRHPTLNGASDDVLAEACRVIAIDEAAHYNFFLEAARLFLYYEPDQAVTAMVDVLKHFAMPAQSLIPGYANFGDALNAAGVFSRRIFYADVAKVALEQLGVESIRAVEEGIRRSRLVPEDSGGLRQTSLMDGLDHSFVEGKVRRLFNRVAEFGRACQLEHTIDTPFMADTVALRPRAST